MMDESSAMDQTDDAAASGGPANGAPEAAPAVASASASAMDVDGGAAPAVGEGGGEGADAKPAVARGPLKKAVSAFLHFCAEHRAEVRADHVGANVGEITKHLAEKWRALDDAGKQRYVDTAAADRVRYLSLIHI